MNYHNYILQPYEGIKTRHICPQCGKREFTLYIDMETGEYLNDFVGRCNREASCGYHCPPKDYFLTNGIQQKFKQIIDRKEDVKPISYVDDNVFKSSLKNYEQNHFITFLIKRYGLGLTTKLIENYYIGTGKNGNTIFWQIDEFGKIRTGKIMLYNFDTGKRVKGEYNHINWVHSKIENFNLKQCLFGEHLMKDKSKPIAIVESEKTAIICSLYLPQFIWVATGGLNNLKVDKCKSLKGQNVVLFPDLGGFEKWQIKAEELKKICNVTISDSLEKNATNEAKNKGYDIADYLLQYEPKEFRKQRKFEDLTKKERLILGLNHFRVEDLKEFANRLFRNTIELGYQPINDCIQILEGLDQQNTEDLLDILCIQKILKVTDKGYKLNQ